MPKTIIAMPTFNERENLPIRVEQICALNLPDVSILVVDDNSPDGTGQLAEELGKKYPVQVLHRQQKNGLGPAYIAGFKKALSMGADYVLQMDADGSHQAKYIPQLIAKMDEGVDVVLGSRFAPGGSVDENWSIYRKMLTFWANRIYVPTLLGMPIRDATGGFRLWRRETLVGIDLERIHSTGYVFQVELAYLSHKLGFKMAEVPIHFPDRTLGKSKMSMRIQMEAAVRVWYVLGRYARLRPQDRRTTPYATA
jgi:dolichol-phosphate mannosyltransferase